MHYYIYAMENLQALTKRLCSKMFVGKKILFEFCGLLDGCFIDTGR